MKQGQGTKTKRTLPTSFGVFSPTGHVVMVFKNDRDAERARQALLDNGFSNDDVVHRRNAEVMAELEKSEEHAKDPVQIGQDVAKVEQYLAFAKEGCGFLVVHAPEDDAAKSAAKIVRPFGLKFAEKYNRLTIEELA
jgi:hypothetical protein